jgi:hypothetical protein
MKKHGKPSVMVAAPQSTLTVYSYYLGKGISFNGVSLKLGRAGAVVGSR